MSDRLPEPRLTKIFRLEATLGEVLDLGNLARQPGGVIYEVYLVD